MRNHLIFSCLLLAAALLLGSTQQLSAQQDFKFSAGIATAKHSGFYKINLQPALIAKCNGNLYDLRIIDGGAHFIPYVRYLTPSVKMHSKVFPMTKIIEGGDSITSVVVENEGKVLTGSLWLEQKNTSVSRTADLLGSDDGHLWFAIAERIVLQQSAVVNSDTYVQTISFPPGNYKYFKLKIDNQKGSPVKILRVGTYSENKSIPEFLLLPTPRICRFESSDKITHLKVKFRDHYQVNRVVLHIKHPKYYKRDIVILSVGGNRKERIEKATLSSDSPSEILISSKTGELEILILNGENPPLQINQIQAFQSVEYILAYLESGNTYKLLFGNPKAQPADYDLKFFAGKQQTEIPVLNHLPHTKNLLFKTNVAKPKSNYSAPIWISIAMALLLLSFLSWKLTQELKIKDQINSN